MNHPSAKAHFGVMLFCLFAAALCAFAAVFGTVGWMRMVNGFACVPFNLLAAWLNYRSWQRWKGRE